MPRSASRSPTASAAFLRTNPAFERFLGYGPGELVGAQVRTIVHPEDWAADAAMFQQIRQGLRTSYQIEKRYVRKDGSVAWGRLVASGVRRQDGSLFGIGMVEDITEQRVVKEQLDRSRAQLERGTTVSSCTSTMRRSPASSGAPTRSCANGIRRPSACSATGAAKRSAATSTS